jgi:hypothetical protein
MDKKINWPKVWMEIGQAFEKKGNLITSNTLDKNPKRNSEMTSIGLCKAFECVINDESIPNILRGNTNLGDGLCWYVYETNINYEIGINVEFYTFRATFCYFMAAMGDEFEEFLEWCKEN